METTPKISIIVPVYKVEKYLRRCLDSIVAQTFTDWECILIDDGSPDNSGKICDEYAEKDGRFRVIHQENAGVSAARNAGLDAAKGEWIGFVDSDDWIEKETYEVAYKKAIEKGVNVVCYGAKFFKNGNFSNVPFKDKGDIFYKFQHYRVYMHSLCNKLIKRELIGGKRLNTEMKGYEDLVFEFDILTDADIKIAFYEMGLYCYSQENVNSSRHLVDIEHWSKSLDLVKEIVCSIYQKKQLYEKNQNEYFEFINFMVSKKYIIKLELFNPNEFRTRMKGQSVLKYCDNIKTFIISLLVYLRIDFLAHYILKLNRKFL